MNYYFIFLQFIFFTIHFSYSNIIGTIKCSSSFPNNNCFNTQEESLDLCGNNFCVFKAFYGLIGYKNCFCCNC